MATWAATRSQVKDHLWREDLTDAVVDQHLHHAVRFIERMRDWYWLEDTQTSAASSEDQIAEPTDLANVISMSVIDTDGTVNPLRVKPFPVLRASWQSTLTGRPIEYANHDGILHVAPAPDQAYQYEITYRIKLGTPVDDATVTTNYLTANHDLVLSYRAAHTLAAGYLKNDADAGRFAGLFNEEINPMLDEDDARKSDMYGGEIDPDDNLYVAAHGYTNWFS
jgi:hypothetical protein